MKTSQNVKNCIKHYENYKYFLWRSECETDKALQMSHRITAYINLLDFNKFRKNTREAALRRLN